MTVTQTTVISKDGAYIINKHQQVDVKNKDIKQTDDFVVTKDLDDKTVQDIVENRDDWTINGK
jgi:hypothetical protein